jgi:hypothetical protein
MPEDAINRPHRLLNRVHIRVKPKHMNNGVGCDLPPTDLQLKGFVKADTRD